MDTKFVQEVLVALDSHDADKVRAMFANYNIGEDDFEDSFELVKYRIKQDNEGFEQAGNAV
jgi:hypothetical protein